MIDRRLKTIIVIYLWAALVEDTVLFVMAWLAPDIWFRLLHAGVPAGLETAWEGSSRRRTGFGWARQAAREPALVHPGVSYRRGHAARAAGRT